MNTVIKNSTALIVIGFGFNDEHLQSILEEKLKKGLRLILLTKEWTEKTQELISENRNITAFQFHRNGCECSFNGKKFIFNKELWQLDSFLSHIIE